MNLAVRLHVPVDLEAQEINMWKSKANGFKVGDKVAVNGMSTLCEIIAIFRNSDREIRYIVEDMSRFSHIYSGEHIKHAK